MNNYQINRQDFYQKMENNSLVLLYSGALKQTSADECYPFYVNTNFYYLTGINQEDVYFLAAKIKGEVHETLFVIENDPNWVKWIGARLYPNEATAISGIEDIKFLPELDKVLVKLLNRKSLKRVYLDLEKHSFKGEVDFGKVLKDKINAISFDKNIIDCYQLITKIRGVKKPYEVEIYKKAVEVTKLALNEVMEYLPKAEYEYQVQACFEGAIKRIGNARVSFNTIAASGKNATVLHYSTNSCLIDHNDMILLDLGAEIGKYHADISRTYPTSGKFNDLQRKVYSIVLECNKYIISQIRPGVTIKDLQRMTIDFLANGMLEAGLMKEKEEISKYYFHGISHHIGLDTHDPIPRDNSILEPGNIISCEPGLYISELGIGVRIEDDILVTKDGNINLSEDIIKEIDDIENYMASFIK